MVNQMVNGDGRAAVNQEGNKQNGNGAVLLGGVGKDNSKMGGATNSGGQTPGQRNYLENTVAGPGAPSGQQDKHEGDHDYDVWTKLSDKCNSDCARKWSDGSKLFSYPSEGLKPTPADLSGRPQVVYGALPFFDASDPSNYTTPGGRVVQSLGANGSITNTTLKDHVFCCGTITRTLMITPEATLYMNTHGRGYNVYMGTQIRSDALANYNSYAGQQIFRALDKQLINYMTEGKK